MNISDQLLSFKLKTILLLICGFMVISIFLSYEAVERYEFHKISKENVLIQKGCIGQVLATFKNKKIPMILFDIKILPEIFQARSKAWHVSDHECKTLCKYHIEDKNVVTFAIEGARLKGKDQAITNIFTQIGFSVHVTYAPDPRLHSNSYKELIPTYLWLAYRDHVVHIAVLHERPGNYMWIGPVTDQDWLDTIETLSPQLSGGWQSMDTIGAQFPRYAQAFDKSRRFMGLPLDIDGHRVTVPYHIKKFLAEYKQSHFEECDHYGAKTFKKIHNLENSNNSEVVGIIENVKAVLDKLDISFWIIGDTCLEYFRQCDIPETSKVVELGIWDYEFNNDIVAEMENNGLQLIYQLGKHSDSLELIFLAKNQVKLNLIFFYKKIDFYWHGGTAVKDGRKFIFKYQPFDLCWSVLENIKIRIPCDSQKFIEDIYGHRWRQMHKHWMWNVDPTNVETNGKWDKQEMNKTVKIFHIKSSGDNLIEKKIDISNM